MSGPLVAVLSTFCCVFIPSPGVCWAASRSSLSHHLATEPLAANQSVSAIQQKTCADRGGRGGVLVGWGRKWWRRIRSDCWKCCFWNCCVPAVFHFTRNGAETFIPAFFMDVSHCGTSSRITVLTSGATGGRHLPTATMSPNIFSVSINKWRDPRKLHLFCLCVERKSFWFQPHHHCHT